jgi:hypothetical protein
MAEPIIEPVKAQPAKVTVYIHDPEVGFMPLL